MKIRNVLLPFFIPEFCILIKKSTLKCFKYKLFCFHCGKKPWKFPFYYFFLLKTEFSFFFYFVARENENFLNFLQVRLFLCTPTHTKVIPQKLAKTPFPTVTWDMIGKRCFWNAFFHSLMGKCSRTTCISYSNDECVSWALQNQDIFPVCAACSAAVSFLTRRIPDNHHHRDCAVEAARDLLQAVWVMCVGIETEKVNERRMIDRRPGMFSN